MEINMKESSSVKPLEMIKNIYRLLTGREKVKVFVLFLLDLGSVALSLISIGALLPYIYVIFEPESVQNYPVLDSVAELFGAHENMEFVVLASALLLAIYAGRCLYIVFYNYVSTKYLVGMVNHYSVNLFRYYITRPTEYYFSRNTAEMQFHYSSAAANLLNGVLVAVIELLVAIIKAVLLIIIMFILKCEAAIVPVLILIALNALLYEMTGKKTRVFSEKMNSIGKTMVKDSIESFRMITELQVFRKYEAAIRRQAEERSSLRDIQLKRNLLIGVPSAIVDFFTLALILTLLVTNYAMEGDVRGSIALLSVSIVCVFELRDTVLSGFDVLNGVRQNTGQYEDAYKDISAAVMEMREKERKESKTTVDFKDTLELNKVSYRYPGMDYNVIESLTLTIRQGEFIGISGPSGVGKTTLAKVLLGLLLAQGEITVDGVCHDMQSDVWRAIFGYVPQEIFLMEGTIAKNVALEYNEENIDAMRVRNALEVAKLIDFIDTLPDGIHTQVGENGSLLSGGQRQRIGIARAIYSNPKILIFDESTSALDYETENSFIDTVRGLKGRYTILFVTHRKESLKYCDWIIEMTQ
jgi:ATP-binding cassette, subfamily B, bacterial PglK